MNEIEFQTDFPCFVLSQKQKEFLSPCEKLSLEGQEFFVLPLTSLLPFCIHAQTMQGKNYKIFSYESKLHCFLFSVSQIAKTNIEKVKVGGETVTITISSSKVQFATEQQSVAFPLTFAPTEYICKNIGTYCVVLFTSPTKEFLYCYNPKTQKHKSFSGKEFAFEQNKVTFKQTFEDFASSILEKTLSFERDEIVESISSSTFSPNTLSPNAVCYAFLDCVMEENFSLAKTLLSKSLSTTENQKLQDYFGNYFKFFPLSQTCFALIYPKEIKTICFSVQDGKIVDFSVE